MVFVRQPAQTFGKRLACTRQVELNLSRCPRTEQGTTVGMRVKLRMQSWLRTTQSQTWIAVLVWLCARGGLSAFPVALEGADVVGELMVRKGIGVTLVDFGKHGCIPGEPLANQWSWMFLCRSWRFERSRALHFAGNHGPSRWQIGDRQHLGHGRTVSMRLPSG